MITIKGVIPLIWLKCAMSSTFLINFYSAKQRLPISRQLVGVVKAGIAPLLKSTNENIVQIKKSGTGADSIKKES